MAVPFDNGPDALATCAAAKREKYAELRRILVARGKDVQMLGFVVGALGSWFPGNEWALSRLGISRSYQKLMRRLCCIDAIGGSRDIYVEHMSGHRQYVEEVWEWCPPFPPPLFLSFGMVLMVKANNSGA